MSEDRHSISGIPIVDNEPRLVEALPVIDKARVVGIVSRTDVLRSMHHR